MLSKNINLIRFRIIIWFVCSYLRYKGLIFLVFSQWYFHQPLFVCAIHFTPKKNFACVRSKPHKVYHSVSSPSHHPLTRSPSHLSPGKSFTFSTVWVPRGRNPPSEALSFPSEWEEAVFNGSERLAWQQMGVQLAQLSLLELEAILLPTATCTAGLMPPQHLAKPLHVMIRVQDGRQRDVLLHLSDQRREEEANGSICGHLF